MSSLSYLEVVQIKQGRVHVCCSRLYVVHGSALCVAREFYLCFGMIGINRQVLMSRLESQYIEIR